MKKGYKILFILLAIFSITVIVNKYNAETYGHYTYTVENNEVTITKYDGTATNNLEIPDSIDGMPVVCIGEAAFRSCSNITGNLVIPDSIKMIGDCAFYECEGFNGTLSLGKNVDIIDTWAFGHCTGFTGDLVIPDSVKEIGRNSFYNCCSLNGTLRIGKSVEIVGSEAFSRCAKLKNKSIPKTVKIIEQDVFGYDLNRYVKVTGIVDKAYTGKSITQSIKVADEDYVLTYGEEYTVSYKNNVKVGKATIVITGKGDFCGTITKTFNIKNNIAKAKVSGIKTKTYNGKSQKQSITVKFGSKKLKAGKDYTVTYKNNKNAGTASLIITGKGNYLGTKTVKFKINKKSISKLSFSKVKNYTYTGKALTPSVTVKYSKTKLVKNKDYTITYSKNTKVGKATITIKGKGNYTGTKKITFKINKRKITSAKITGIVNKQYTGKKITQKITITYNGKTLKNKTDYTISYKNNIKHGTATVTIKGKGNFTGSYTKKFKIIDPYKNYKKVKWCDKESSYNLIVDGYGYQTKMYIENNKLYAEIKEIPSNNIIEPKTEAPKDYIIGTPKSVEIMAIDFDRSIAEIYILTKEGYLYYGKNDTPQKKLSNIVDMTKKNGKMYFLTKDGYMVNIDGKKVKY